MNNYKTVLNHLSTYSYRWFITGAAGFIGSHCVEALLKLNQDVVGIDNFSTGYQKNLDDIKNKVTDEQWQRFTFIEADLLNSDAYKIHLKDIDFILHQAALASVSLSMENPLAAHHVNVNGFLEILELARKNNIQRLVYATSSAVYGDDDQLPSVESHIGSALSPYAATKRINEIYANVYSKCYGLETIGLRYFNIFGPRQDPNGAYASVIPNWIIRMLKKEEVIIYGDGKTSRDFCYVENVVQANILAALSKDHDALNQIYNVALNERYSLDYLFKSLCGLLIEQYPHLEHFDPTFSDFRKGDIRHSQADISRATRLLGYKPTCSFQEGLKATVDWFMHSK